VVGGEEVGFAFGGGERRRLVLVRVWFGPLFSWLAVRVASLLWSQSQKRMRRPFHVALVGILFLLSLAHITHAQPVSGYVVSLHADGE
jgi:hypothetical protein